VDNYPGNNPLHVELVPFEGSGKPRSVVKGRSRMNGILGDPRSTRCNGIIRSEGERERTQGRIRENNARILLTRKIQPR